MEYWLLGAQNERCLGDCPAWHLGPLRELACALPALATCAARSLHAGIVDCVWLWSPARMGVGGPQH